MTSKRAAEKRLKWKKMDGLVKCTRCPPNKGENMNRQVKPDRYKSKRKGRC